jgi:DNA-binding MarR family transcriptional regulator
MMVSMETTGAGNAIPDLEAHLGYWLRRVSNQVSGAFARSLLARNVAVAEWVVLNQIHHQPDVRPADLADALGLTRGAVSKVLDKLEGKHWILRRTLAEDHRVQQLTLSTLGRRALPELAAIAGQNDKQFFDCLSAREQASLRQILRTLSTVHHIHQTPIE